MPWGEKLRNNLANSFNPGWGVGRHINKSTDALKQETGNARMAFLVLEAREGRTKERDMTDLHDVAMFCLFYSGVVVSALWMTIAQRPIRVEVKEQRNSNQRF